MYYRRIYNVHTENIPASGTPLMIVSNHQNCLNDPLGILFSMCDRKPYFIMRADVFDYHPVLNKFFRGLGLLPAFRIDFEGVEALSKNKDTFVLSEQMLLDGNTLVMFPESGHQDKRWLNNFTFGFTKMAFEAAALGNFETDILILPACNHYSDYFRLQEQMVIKYGTPISIKPFYELYQTKPRTAQRQLSALVRQQMEELMLDIRDLDNYEAIDFIRHTYGKRFAVQHQYDQTKLPDRLLSDRLLVTGLEKARSADKEKEFSELYANALTLKKGLDEMQIDVTHFEQCPSWMAIIVRLLLLLLFFPLWLFSLWPNALNYVIPTILINRMTDKMFYGSFLLIFSTMITIPLLYTLTFVLTWIYANIWLALVYVAILPVLGLFAWYYLKYLKQTMQALHFRRNIKTKKLNNLNELRKGLIETLDQLLTNSLNLKL